MNAILRTLVITALACFAALPAAAQTLTFTNKTTADGLGDNSVFGVYANGSTV